MKDVLLSKGNHQSREAGMCAMEFAAYLAGIEHTDQPQCVSPVLRVFMIRWNDDLDDETRQKLRPYISRTIGTAGDGQDRVRAYMALDWLVRVHAPAFLDVAGLRDEAQQLRALPQIMNEARADEALPTIRAAYSTANPAAKSAASSAADYAAKSAADYAAKSAAYSAAYSAADYAAKSAAYSAAYSAANSTAYSTASSAAESAAKEVLAPVVKELQTSAFDLLDRMIDPNGIHDVKTEAEFLALKESV